MEMGQRGALAVTQWKTEQEGSLEPLLHAPQRPTDDFLRPPGWQRWAQETLPL